MTNALCHLQYLLDPLWFTDRDPLLQQILAILVPFSGLQCLLTIRMATLSEPLPSHVCCWPFLLSETHRPEVRSKWVKPGFKQWYIVSASVHWTSPNYIWLSCVTVFHHAWNSMSHKRSQKSHIRKIALISLFKLIWTSLSFFFSFMSSWRSACHFLSIHHGPLRGCRWYWEQ